MQSLKLSIAALAAVLSFPAAACVAQSATANADSSTSAQANAITDRYMTSVQTELTSKVDSKNAAVGQEVAARVRETAKLADGTTLPKGTKLIGHVTQVQASGKDQAYSALTMTFDRAELKGGQSVALRSVIRTVAPPANVGASSNDSLMADDPMGPISAGASAGGMGSANPRTGLGGVGGGGIAGGAVRGVGQTAGGVGQTAGGAGRTAGTAMGDVTDDARSMTQTAAHKTGGAVTQAGETLSTAPRATALPGVMLSTSGTANAAGTLVASGRNISLDSGTQITLGLITR